MIIIIIKCIGPFRLYASPMFLVPNSWSHPPCGMVQRTQVQHSHSTSTSSGVVLLPLGGWLGGVTKKYCTDAYIKIMRPSQIPMKRTGKDRNTFQEGLDFLPVSSNCVLAASSMFCCLLHAGTLWSLSFCRTAILCLFLSPLFSPLLFWWISR